MGSGGAGLFHSVSYTVLKRVFKLQPGSSSTGTKVGRAQAVRDPRPKADSAMGTERQLLLPPRDGRPPPLPLEGSHLRFFECRSRTLAN